MAILTAEEKAEIRIQLQKYSAKNDIPINYVVGAVNDAAQAIENELAAIQAQIIAAVDSATVVPYGIQFTNTQKKIIGAHVFHERYNRDKD